MSTSLALIDDHNLLRSGFISLLSGNPGTEVIYDSADAESFLRWLETTSTIPDVLLLDIELPGMNGIELLEILKTDYPSIKIIVVSMHVRESLVSGLIEKGVHSYLPKNCESEELFTAISTVVKSGFYFNELVLRSLHNTMRHEKKKSADTTYGYGISEREREVLSLICQEYSSQEIGEKLFISVRTVEGHRNNLIQKSGVKNTSGLVMFAVKNGIVDPWF